MPPKREPAPERGATKAEHKKHAEEFLTRPEHKTRPKGYPDPEHEFDEAKP